MWRPPSLFCLERKRKGSFFIISPIKCTLQSHKIHTIPQNCKGKLLTNKAKKEKTCLQREQDLEISIHNQLSSICEELTKLTETQIKIQKDTTSIVAD